jgi:hypothetical protein
MGPLPAISKRSQDLSTAMAPVLPWIKKKLQYVPFPFLTQRSLHTLMVFFVACRLWAFTFCKWFHFRECVAYTLATNWFEHRSVVEGG